MDPISSIHSVGHRSMENVLTSIALIVIGTGLVLGQADVPVVQLGVSEELVHSGREASITCRVQNQGDYKISLEKHIKLHHDDITHIDLIALDEEVTEKYANTGRFSSRKVTFGRNALYILDMKNVSYYDTARYVCKVLGASVRDHAELAVYKQVNKVEFDKFMEGDIITFKEGISREVSCSASQSIPVADINIKVAGRDRTQINQHTERKLADCWQKDQDNCLLHYYYNTHATAQQIVTRPEDDGKKLSCGAMIPESNMLPVETSIEISVLYKPQISCEYNHTAFLHSEFEISCTVQSNPAPTTYIWRYTGDPMVKGSSQISSGYKVEDTQILYSTNKELGEKLHEVILHFPEVKPHHFTNFTLHVTNVVGNSTAQVILLEADGDGDPVNGGDSSGVPFYAPVIVILSLLSFMCIQCCKR